MIKPNNRKMSTCIFMAAISINDYLMMIFALYTWLIGALKIHIWNEIECKSLSFLSLLTPQNTTYLVLAMTIDKYIAIKWPHKSAMYSTAKRAKITIIVTYACIFIYNSPHAIFSSVVGHQCVSYVNGGFVTKVYSWLTFVLNAIIPFTVLFNMNYVIINKVRQSRKMFKNEEIYVENSDTTAEKKRQFTMENAENQLTIMLLLVTTLFLVLLIPTYVRFLYLTFVKPETPEKYAGILLFISISYNLYITNSGINFFLYCISGQKFRNDLKEILCGRRKSWLNSASGVTEASIVEP